MNSRFWNTFKVLRPAQCGYGVNFKLKLKKIHSIIRMCTVIPKQKLQSMHDYKPELNLVVFYGSNPLQALLRSSTLYRLTESEWAFPFEEYPEKAFTSHLQLLPSRFAKRLLSCWLIFRAGKWSDNPFTDFDLESEALLKTNMNYCSVLACWCE